jgi:hypothetical protein
MRIRFAAASAFLVLASVLAFTAATATAAAPAQTQSLSVPITPTQSGGALDGVFTLTSFAVNSTGQLVANGTFTGTFTNAAGLVTNYTDTLVSSIVTPAQTTAGCQILDLVLGPLHLNVLGLDITLNQVHLNITAQPGPGNLLGNLLCAVAHLLDNTGSTNTTLQNLLNILNGLLGA